MHVHYNTIASLPPLRTQSRHSDDLTIREGLNLFKYLGLNVQTNNFMETESKNKEIATSSLSMIAQSWKGTWRAPSWGGVQSSSPQWFPCQ